tara:strand:- start:1206 stop:1346 length:141 start_codon:yes stop_codon:yes gene_type:complete
MSTLNNYIPVKDYALKMGISVQAVYTQIKKGKLEHIKIGSYFLIKP